MKGRPFEPGSVMGCSLWSLVNLLIGLLINGGNPIFIKIGLKIALDGGISPSKHATVRHVTFTVHALQYLTEIARYIVRLGKFPNATIMTR
jgi:hypothetical protein